MSDSSNRTEQATPRRIEKARKEGNFVSTREMVSGAQFAVFAAILLSGFTGFLNDAAAHTKSMLRLAFTGADLQRETIVAIFQRRLAPTFGIILLCGLALPLIAVAAQLAASRLGIAGKKLAPDFKRLNPVPRLQGLATQNLSQFLRSTLLLPVFLGIAGWLLWSNAARFSALPLLPWGAGITVVGDALREVIEWSIYLFLLIGAFDWFRQHQQYMKKLRMSKQEIRDEHKEVEGNPQIKAKVRRMQRDMSRRRMMADVPKASAVIVNPTHYSVAIRYELNGSAAPRVVAKGKNHLARRIRELAIANEVPIIENPPLARALYAAADVGQEIPPHLYKAVAEILAYLYRILGGRLPGQSAA